MNPLLAASLFDSPWIILAIMAASAIANWLSKRRQQQQEQQEELENPSAAPELELSSDFERRLREMLGQEPPLLPAPPVIQETAADDWAREARGETAPVPRRQDVTAVLPPPLISESAFQPGPTAVRRVEATARPAPTALVAESALRPSRRRAGGVNWRNPRTARQAFVASLVFGPPKGLEN